MQLNNIIRITILIVLMLPVESLSAQYNDNNGQVNLCTLFSPYQIDVDEFLSRQITDTINHDEPYIGLTWGYPANSEENKSYILQVDLTASRTNDKHIPLNVCVVIDRSASMKDHLRMEKVKVAMKEFLKLLQPDDYASIVVYDNNASVLLPTRRRDEYGLEYISSLIDSIKLGANTNMVSGMILGYKEVLKNYDPMYANRVILLTDGITNLGITDPAAIIEQSNFYSRRDRKSVV